MAILRGNPDRDIISSGSNADTLLGFAGNSTNSDPNQNGGNHERHAEDHVLDELFT